MEGGIEGTGTVDSVSAGVFFPLVLPADLPPPFLLAEALGLAVSVCGYIEEHNMKSKPRKHYIRTT